MNQVPPLPKSRGTIPPDAWKALCAAYEEAVTESFKAYRADSDASEARKRAQQALLVYETVLLETQGQLRLPGVS